MKSIFNEQLLMESIFSRLIFATTTKNVTRNLDTCCLLIHKSISARRTDFQPKDQGLPLVYTLARYILLISNFIAYISKYEKYAFHEFRFFFENVSN